MKSEYPYQLVAFIGKEPSLGEPAYSGANGWYPQIALKRRFNVTSITESELKVKIDQFCKVTEPFTIKVGELTQPDRMPVRVLEVEYTPELMNFHTGLITYLGDSITSRFPERDGANYLPHITAEWENEIIIDLVAFTNKEIQISSVCLLKDTDDGDSAAYYKFSLG